jgi:hypothetical protein
VRLGRTVRLRRHARGQHADYRGNGHHVPARAGGHLQEDQEGHGREKKLGFILGRPENQTLAAIYSGRRVRKLNARADENNRRAAALATFMRAYGQSWTAIAIALNGAGFRTRLGKEFRPVQVQCVLALFT